jgi:hypothetical protein
MASHRRPSPRLTRLSRTARRASQRRPTRAHLLIIECDAGKLAADGLYLGSPFGQLVQKVFPEKRIVVVQTSTKDKLKEDLANVVQTHGRFRSILIVGHSNEVGLTLTSDCRCGWTAVGNWLQIFEPEFVFLAACEAGRSEAVRGLFMPLRKTLRQVYASPVALHRSQTPSLAVLIVMLLMQGRIDEDQSGALRLANYVLTGGQLFRWKRGETGLGEELRARLWDGVASLFNRGTWDLLESLFAVNRQQAKSGQR